MGFGKSKMKYYIKTEWSNGLVYYRSKGFWIVKSSPFYYPKKFTRRQAERMIKILEARDAKEYKIEETA